MLLVNREDYTTGYSLDYSSLKEKFKLVEIDLRKQQIPGPILKAIQQINFTGNADRAGKTAMFSILAEIKENILDF